MFSGREKGKHPAFERSFANEAYSINGTSFLILILQCKAASGTGYSG